jgi:rhodanese-related sulfurtransferase
VVLMGIGAAIAAPVWAQSSTKVSIDQGLPSVEFIVNGKRHVIERIQDENHMLTGSFTKTSRPCPPFCVHPMSAAPGVTTVGELELLEFLKNKVERGSGVLIDARIEAWYKKGTIPGAINIPFTEFERDPSDPRFAALLERLGAKRGKTLILSTGEYPAVPYEARPQQLDWDFSQAKDLLLFCNGPWCDQSPRAIRALIKLGYPPRKLFYYRGGMQLWLLLGFNVEVP